MKIGITKNILPRRSEREGRSVWKNREQKQLQPLQDAPVEPGNVDEGIEGKKRTKGGRNRKENLYVEKTHNDQ